jgi:putative transposase
MLLIRTVPLKIDLSKDEYFPLMEQCSALFNEYVDWAYQNKTYNKIKAHHELYSAFRSKFSELPSAMIQLVRDCAMEAVKRSKFKNKKPRKKLYSAIRYDSRTMTLRGNQLTFSCIGPRQKVILEIPEYFKQYLNSWKFKGGTICYKNSQFWVHLNFQNDDPNPFENIEVLGIDRGLYNFLTFSNGEIINSKLIRKQQRKYLYNRKKLQAKGTRSAKRKLKKLSGKEKRFSRDFNHCISKYVVSLPYGIFAIENLKNIRKQKFSKKLNKWLSSWTFGQFEQFLTYKAESLGKQVVKVDARYTSQKCSSCGIINKDNRNKSKYKCSNCGYTNHADINAAINIKNNFISSMVTSDEQAVVNQLIATTSS